MIIKFDFFFHFFPLRNIGRFSFYSIPIDTFDGAKPRFLNRGKKRRPELALSLVERVNPEHTPGFRPGNVEGLI